MSDCVKHPGQDSMVPCLGCGKSFCRLCDPPRGSGLYCPNCYQEQLERLGGRKAKKEERKPAKARAPRDKPGRASRLAGIQAKILAPFTWVGKKVSAGAAATRKAFVRAGQGTKSGIIAAVLATGRGFKFAAFEAKDRFPVGLTDRELLEGDPPLAKEWLKLLGIVVAGALVWTLLVAVTHVRAPAISICVAALVAWASVWVMGKRFGLAVGVVTAGLVLVCLSFGELAVQFLYRGGILIKKLDLQFVGDKQAKADLAFYRSFAFKLVLYRMLPAAVVAFLIGWWPLKLRPSWVGFEGRIERGRKLPPFKKRSEVRRPGAAGKASVAGVRKRQESRKQAAEES